MFEVEFYDTKDGYCPVREFLNSLEPKMLAKTLRTIDLLQGSNITRAFYFFFVGQKVILTNGLLKKNT